MKADFATIQRALDAPGDTTRLILLHGPDESGTNALAARLAKAMGDAAERTDFSGDQLARDPAALPDAAASISLFGDRSWIRVAPAGEEVLPAVEALLALPRAGNPVVMIAGSLRKTSKLLTACLGHPAALCLASYPPAERDSLQIVAQMARERGLLVDQGIARRIVESSGGDRAVMAGEVEKLALYHDAVPEAPVAASHEALDALSSESAEGDAPVLAGLALAGDVNALTHALPRFRALGGSLAGVLRIALQKAMTVAEIRAGLDSGTQREGALRANGRPLWKGEADEMGRLLRLWPGEAIARGIQRLAAAERASRSGNSGGIGETLIAQELLMIARQASRRR